MKKLLIIMLGVFIFTPLSLKADTYDTNDEPISDLRFYTLNEVFNIVERPLSNYLITQDPNFDILNYTNFIGLNGLTLSELFENNFYEQELPNGVHDEIIDGYKVQRVKKYTFQESDIVSLNKTIHETIDWVAILKKDDDILIGSTTTSLETSLTRLIENYEPGAVFSDNVANAGTFINYSLNSIALGVLADTYDTLAEARADLVGTKIYYQLTEPILIEIGGNITLTKDQMDDWFSVYQNPNLLNGLETMNSNELFFYKDTIFNISKMKTDKIFSPALSTFDSLTEDQMLSQFEQWEYRDFNKVEVLSYNDYLFFNSDGTLQSMLSYYDNYNFNLKNVEASINEIDKNEIIILLIALIAYIIGVIISIYFRNNVLFAGSSLLWFIPVFMIPNVFIITFSIIMIIMSFVITFYNNKEEGFD